LPGGAGADAAVLGGLFAVQRSIEHDHLQVIRASISGITDISGELLLGYVRARAGNQPRYPFGTGRTM
jgi:hypothetical protein